MSRRLGSHGPPHGTGTPGADCGDGKRGDAGRDVGEHVVEPSRGPPEALVSLGVVPDHGIERVGGTMGQHPWSPCERRPQQGGDHGIDGVLGNRLDDRPGDLGTVEFGGIAAHEHREQPAGLRQVVGDERLAHRLRGLAQHPPRRGDGSRDRHRGHPARQQAEADPERRVDCAGTPSVAIPTVLGRRHERSERCHRVHEVGRFADQPVDHDASNGAYRPSHRLGAESEHAREAQGSGARQGGGHGRHCGRAAARPPK